MKRVIILLIVIPLLIGCAVSKYQVKFEDSNAYLIKKSIDNINIVDSLETEIKKSDNIAIVSLERLRTDNSSINTIIEDVLLKKLLDNGYSVLERDDDLLYRLRSESDSSTYSYYLYNKEVELASSAGVESAVVGHPSIMYPYYNVQGAALGVSGSNYYRISNFDKHKYKTNLITADKLIGYRVIESGIIYEEDKSVLSDSLRRNARTILLVRTEDAKTGKILDMKYVEGLVTDKISKKHIDKVEDYHYTHYHLGYPNIYGNYPQKIITGEKKAGKSDKGNKTMLIILGVVVGGVLIGIAL